MHHRETFLLQSNNFVTSRVIYRGMRVYQENVPK